MIFDLINITIGKEMVRYPLLCHANFIIDFIIFSYLFPHMVVFLIHSYKQVLLSYLALINSSILWALHPTIRAIAKIGV